MDAGSPEALHRLANTYQDQGKLDRAISCYRRALRARPDFAEAHNDLGTAYFAKGWYQEAVASYRETLRLNPDNHSAHANLGETLLKLRQFGEARKSMRAAVWLRIRGLLRRLLPSARARS
ncbi:MAG: tetratricopeptide repeat protein [Burkholderiales bacterium]